MSCGSGGASGGGIVEWSPGVETEGPAAEEEAGGIDGTSGGGGGGIVNWSLEVAGEDA